MKLGRHVAWRWQGVKSCCWLTCIEMMMQYKHGSIYGANQGVKRTAHSAAAITEFDRDEGSHIELHAGHYGLVENTDLARNSDDLAAWTRALSRGPVIAEGNYGWARFGLWPHVIVIVGISWSDKLIYKNPNVMAVLPHPSSKDSYISVADIHRHRERQGLGPFWQCAEDMPPIIPQLQVGTPSYAWGANLNNTLKRI